MENRESLDGELEEGEALLLDEYLSEDEEDDVPLAVGDLRFSCSFLTPYLKPYHAKILSIAFVILTDMAFNASLPLVERYLIDQGLLSKKINVVIESIGYLCVAFLAISILGIILDFKNSRLVASIISDIRSSLFERLQLYPLGYFKKKRGGVILSRFSGDLLSAEQGVISIAYDVCIPALEVVYSIILLFYFNIQMALVAMMVIPLALVAPKKLAKKTFRLGYEKRKIEARVLGSVHQNISSQAVVKAFDLGKQQIQSFSVIASKWTGSSFRFNLYGALVERSSTIGVYFLHLVVFSLGVMWVWNGKLSLGTLVAFESLFLYMGEAVTYVTESVPVLAQASGGMRHLSEFFNGEIEAPDQIDSNVMPRISKQIELVNISATYPGTRFSIKNINLKLECGGHYALVGDSGAGKSTLLGLLLRLFEPTKGEILFDGLNINKYSRSSLREQCAIVFQDSLLFNMSVADNIAMGKEGATRSDIETAARKAEIHDFILELPNGYETSVGERGERLSGGQRQRIAIARALIRNPSILLLDEATSSLDLETEASILSTISRISHDRTVISVNHRLSATVNCDGIFVMKKGRIVESGTHSELISAKGAYGRSWRRLHPHFAGTGGDPGRHGQEACAGRLQEGKIPR